MKQIILYFFVITFNISSAQQQPCASIVQPKLSDEIRKHYEQNLDEARSRFKIDSLEAEHIIWYGRRMAYLGRYMEAITIFTRGLALHPNNPRFFRHRGHRYITVRCFDKAISDLSKGAEMLKDQVDEVEPDGLPNAQNIPTSTLKTNTLYHLGLAYFIKGDYKNALNAYAECIRLTDNDDMYVATANWLYITLLRVDQKKEAEELLQTIHPGLDLIENRDYYDILMLYKTGNDKDLLAKTQGMDSISNATSGFGLANYYLEKGPKKKAKEIFEKILAGNQWASFGFIAAEAELKRMK
jgi:tetratricopeptide (TPR) repeat protein